MSSSKKLSVVDKDDLRRFSVLMLILLVGLAVCLSVILYQDYTYGSLEVILCFLIAVYIADFTSGLFHFFVDYTPHKKGVGLDLLYYYKGNKGSKDYYELKNKVFAKAGEWQRSSYFFKMHHLDKPKLIATRPAFTTFIPTLPLSMGLFGWSILLSLAGKPVASLVFCQSGLIVFWAQYLHSVTHGRESLKLISFLQKYHILLSKSRHSFHHKYPDQYFCFVNGWADPVVNRLAKLFFALGLFDKRSLVPPAREFKFESMG